MTTSPAACGTDGDLIGAVGAYATRLAASVAYSQRLRNQQLFDAIARASDELADYPWLRDLTALHLLPGLTLTPESTVPRAFAAGSAAVLAWAVRQDVPHAITGTSNLTITWTHPCGVTIDVHAGTSYGQGDLLAVPSELFGWDEAYIPPATLGAHPGACTLYSQLRRDGTAQDQALRTAQDTITTRPRSPRTPVTR